MVLNYYSIKSLSLNLNSLNLPKKSSNVLKIVELLNIQFTFVVVVLTNLNYALYTIIFNWVNPMP